MKNYYLHVYGVNGSNGRRVVCFSYDFACSNYSCLGFYRFSKPSTRKRFIRLLNMLNPKIYQLF